MGELRHGQEDESSIQISVLPLQIGGQDFFCFFNTNLLPIKHDINDIFFYIVDLKSIFPSSTF